MAAGKRLESIKKSVRTLRNHSDLSQCFQTHSHSVKIRQHSCSLNQTLKLNEVTDLYSNFFRHRSLSHSDVFKIRWDSVRLSWNLWDYSNLILSRRQCKFRTGLSCKSNKNQVHFGERSIWKCKCKLNQNTASISWTEYRNVVFG